MLRGVVASLVVLMACGRPKATAEPEAATSSAAARPSSEALPAGVVASVDGTLITEATFARVYEDELLDFGEEALGDADVEHLVDAVLRGLILNELLRAELDRLGIGEAGIAALLEEIQPRLAMVPMDLIADPVVAHVVEPPLVLALAIANRAHIVDDAMLAAAYESRKHELTSKSDWLALDRLELLYTASVAGTTGIAVCDDTIAVLEACAKTPGSRAEPEALANMVSMIREMSGDAERKSFAAILCTSLGSESATTMEDLGCASKPVAKPSKADAAALAKGRDATRKRAVALQRRASAPRADYVALAGESGDTTTNTTFVTADELEPDLARAVATLQPGGVTPPIAGDSRWVIVRVRGRWAPGFAPLEVRREQLVAEITGAQMQAAQTGLYERLSATHRVVMRRPEPPKIRGQ